MNTKPKIGVIIGSIREGRFGDKPAKWILNLAKERAEIDVEMIDLKNWELPFFSESTSPKYANGQYKNPLNQTWSEKIKEFDGFIIVAPEYNHGTSAVLKNAIDYLWDEWNNKPVAFVSYGSEGGARAIEHLRLVAIEVKMLPIRDYVAIPLPWNLVNEDDSLKDGALESFESPAKHMLDSLIWLTKIMHSEKIR